MELGGSAAVYVSDDANVESAAKKCVVGAMAYAGQVCISVQRIYVQQQVISHFLDAIIEQVKPMSSEDPRMDGHILGPMIDSIAANRFLDLCHSLDQPHLLVSPRIHNGRYVSPVVVSGLSENHPLIQTEAFAPVIVLQTVSHLSDAIAKINGTPYGLQSGIFTNRFSDAIVAHKELRGGAVFINDVPTVRIDKLSYGGDGQSGRGREGIRDVMNAYTTPKHLIFS